MLLDIQVLSLIPCTGGMEINFRLHDVEDVEDVEVPLLTLAKGVWEGEFEEDSVIGGRKDIRFFYQTLGDFNLRPCTIESPPIGGRIINDHILTGLSAGPEIYRITWLTDYDPYGANINIRGVSS